MFGTFMPLGIPLERKPQGFPWMQQTTPYSNQWTTVAYGNGTFVAISPNATSNNIITSPDGINWTGRTAHTGGFWWHSVRFLNGQFVALSTDGTMRVMTSPNGVNWTVQALAEPSPHDVAYSDTVGRYLAVGEGSTNNAAIATPAGTSWTPRALQTPRFCFGVAFGKGIFVVVGDSGGTALAKRKIISSVDPTTLVATERVRNNTGGNAFNYVIYGEDLFIASPTVPATGQGNVVTSTDGINWTQRNIGPSLGYTFLRMVFSKGVYVGVGAKPSGSGFTGMIMSSEDGINWTERSAPTVSMWDGVAYGAGKFVAVSRDGMIATAP